jgi:periplasmic protein TonB
MTALADDSAHREPAREPTTIRGVYRGVFEQSLLLNDGIKRPWNFLASVGAELLIVTLALLIPLLYREHLPTVHWKDIVVGPPPAPPPAVPQRAHDSPVTNTTPSLTLHRPFVFSPRSSAQTPPTTPGDFTPEAPPSIGPDTGLGGRTNALGTFIPNIVALPPPPSKPIVEKKPSGPLPVGGDVEMALLIRKVVPEYPALAKSARISGVVRLIGTIAKDGTIQNLRLVSGHPLLAHAAMEAVRQWVFKPTFLNGQPVEVIAPIEVHFTLGQ